MESSARVSECEHKSLLLEDDNKWLVKELDLANDNITQASYRTNINEVDVFYEDKYRDEITMLKKVVLGSAIKLIDQGELITRLGFAGIPFILKRIQAIRESLEVHTAVPKARLNAFESRYMTSLSSCLPKIDL